MAFRRPSRVVESGTRAAPRVRPPIGPPPEGRPKLGEILRADDLITEADLVSALSHQEASGRRLGAILIDQAVINDRILAEALAIQFEIPLADLRHEIPQAEATVLVTEAAARSLTLIPLRLESGKLRLALADPLDERVAELLAVLPVDEVELHLAPAEEIRSSINACYRALAAVGEHVEAFRLSEDERAGLEQSGRVEVDEDAPVIQIVNKIVTQALRDRASDIHIEPSDERLRIRYRIDGALNEVLTLPIAMGSALVSRIKIMATMNIVERRRPQDGQFQMTIDGRDVDVRVATSATIYGEKAVLRILDKSRSLYTLKDLGMPTEIHERYSQIARSPFGMLVVSGPTGSGKTTTLYATLTEINRTELNITTIEDPVEYVFPSINQIQINEQADITFATGLKSILRQDPDVILVGEVRDVETARIAVQSALTGHFVLSSIHATDASSALYRLLDMGIEPFLVGSSIVGVVAQRLVRRICPGCRSPFEPPESDLFFYEQLGGTRRGEVWYHGDGCNLCSGTGYRDRIGVFEVLSISDEIRHLVVSGGTPQALRAVAIEQGMRPLRSEALRLVDEGITTIAEIIRTVYVV